MSASESVGLCVTHMISSGDGIDSGALAYLIHLISKSFYLHTLHLTDYRRRSQTPFHAEPRQQDQAQDRLWYISLTDQSLKCWP